MGNTIQFMDTNKNQLKSDIFEIGDKRTYTNYSSKTNFINVSASGNTTFNITLIYENDQSKKETYAITGRTPVLINLLNATYSGLPEIQAELNDNITVSENKPSDNTTSQIKPSAINTTQPTIGKSKIKPVKKHSKKHSRKHSKKHHKKEKFEGFGAESEQMCFQPDKTLIILLIVLLIAILYKYN